MQLAPGTIIDDKYQIVAAVGSGAMGSVYRAIQRPFNRVVALKVLNATSVEEMDGMARFEREAKSLCSIKNKNIILFYGYGVWQGSPYMVTEFVQGDNLERRLERGKLPIPEAIHIIQQVCDGLGSAHQHGIIHRDLKPSNIMLTSAPDGKHAVKIIDFGLSKILPGYGQTVQKLTDVGCALGTVLYMSPEQCLGDELHATSDIYAAGCVLYHCLTGSPPFTADDGLTVMNLHLSETSPRLNLTQSGIINLVSLQKVLDKATTKRWEDRYQTAEEFRDDLLRIAEGKTVAIRSADVSQPLAVFAPKQEKFGKRAKMSLLAVSASLSVMMGVVFWQAISNNSKAPTSRSTAKSKSVSTLLNWQKTREESETFSLLADGRLLILQGRPDKAREVLNAALEAQQREHVVDWQTESNTLALIGECDMALTDYSHAVEVYEKAVKLLEEKSKTSQNDLMIAMYKAMSEAYAHNGNEDGVAATLQKCYDADKRSGRADCERLGVPVKMAAHLIRIHQPDKAIKLLQESLRRAPDQPAAAEAYAVLANAYEAHGRFADRLRALEKSASLDQPSLKSPGLLLLAKCYVEHDSPEKALTVVNRLRQHWRKEAPAPVEKARTLLVECTAYCELKNRTAVNSVLDELQIPAVLPDQETLETLRAHSQALSEKLAQAGFHPEADKLATKI